MLHFLSHHYILRTEEPVGAGWLGQRRYKRTSGFSTTGIRKVNTKSRNSGDFQHNLWFGV